VLVDRARHQLLAGSALTRDEHRRVDPRHPIELPIQVQHGPALADHLVAPYPLLAAVEVVL